MKLYSGLLLFAICANQSIAQEAKDVLLLVDKSVSTLNGAPYPMPIETAFAITPDDGSEAQLFLSSAQMGAAGVRLKQAEYNYIPNVPMPNVPNYAYGGAMGAGLIAAGIIETKIMMDRQKSIQPLRDILNKGVLRSRFLASAKQAISTHGFNVKETIIMDKADEDMFKTVGNNSDLRHLIMFKKVTQLPITISSDDATPIFVANISYYVRESIRFRKQYDADIIFIGHAAPKAAGSVQYWSHNVAEKYLDELEFGIKAMFNHALTVGPGLPDDKTKKELLREAAKDGSDKVVMLKSDNGFAYGMVENSYYLIAPIQKAPEVKENAYRPFADALERQQPAAVDANSGATGNIAGAMVNAPAKLRVLAKNDSEAETGMRRFTISAYQGDTCDKKTAMKLEDNRLNPKEESSVTSRLYSLTPGISTRINLDYSDARFAQSRKCTSSLSFVPAANQIYQVEFVVDRNISRCDVRLVEVGENNAVYKTAFELPGLVCGTQATNGQPVWTGY